MSRTPWLLLLLAAVIRVYGCAITPVPGRDGVAYLWMAEQFAAGDCLTVFATVFHPLYPALVGVVLLTVPTLDVVIAGQWIAAGCGALAVLPLWATTHSIFGRAAATWAGFMYAIGVWFVRHPADCMSEGPFYLLVALWAAALTSQKRRATLAGVCAGLAFLTRPEGAALAVTGILLLATSGQKRQSIRHAATAIAVALLLPIGLLAAGQGFSLTPKAAFTWNVGAGSAESPLSWYLGQWLRWPGDAWEGLGYMVFPLMIIGAIRHRPRSFADPRLWLLLPFLAQLMVVPVLKSHHRFVSGFGILLLPYAGVLFANWRAHLRGRSWWPTVITVLLVASEAKLFVALPTDRTIERDLGRWLVTVRDPDHTAVSDMPRLLFFAGLRPPPPRRLHPAELLQWASEPQCHFVILKKGRTAIDRGALRQLGYLTRELPDAVANHPHREAIELFIR